MDSKYKDRVDAWRQDTELVVHKHIFGNWSVRGNVTNFFYKLEMDEDKANTYAAELNRNKVSEQDIFLKDLQY